MVASLTLMQLPNSRQFSFAQMIVHDPCFLTWTTYLSTYQMIQSFNKVYILWLLVNRQSSGSSLREKLLISFLRLYLQAETVWCPFPTLRFPPLGFRRSGIGCIKKIYNILLVSLWFLATSLPPAQKNFFTLLLFIVHTLLFMSTRLALEICSLLSTK